VRADASFSQLMREMSDKGLGASAIVDDAGQVLGVFTDGDLRRVLDRGLDLRATPVSTVMIRAPRVIGPRALAADAVNLMQEHRITALLVTDEAGHLVGALNIHDLLRAGVV
jgi:arabinose-5-phosphate isomerase